MHYQSLSPAASGLSKPSLPLSTNPPSLRGPASHRKGDLNMQLNRVMTVAALAVGGVMLSKKFMKNRGSDTSSTVAESIEVNVPVKTAYNQWTQFTEFPRFMDSVQEVRQLDDKHLHWKAKIAGEEKEWDAEITEQIPDKRIAWRSVGGIHNAGVVTFHKISDGCSRIMLQMDYETENMAEHVADILGALRMEVRSNLKNFKDMLEKRGQETGAWRGSVAQH
jgi:uncharacterized membrane protein